MTAGSAATDKLLVTTPELQAMLSCGKNKAVELGDKAGARVTFGRMVRWRINDIKKYIEDKEVKK